jgi:phosphopantothenoylcysteine synthetase/decarboxylase
MKIIVTCGPSYEPIDEVRRITNFSTGELGVLLANRLARDGHEVFCLRGVQATHPGALEGAQLVPFGTNDDLLRELRRLSVAGETGAVLHAAALADYKVKQVTNERGERCDSPKIASRSGALTIELEPATKVISRLRPMFPRAVIVGWKYELNGTRENAFARAWKQLRDNRSDACVLNGRAYGQGFAFCSPPNTSHALENKAVLVAWIADWLKSRQ